MPASRRPWEVCRRLAEMNAEEFCVRARQAAAKGSDLLLSKMGKRFHEEITAASSMDSGQFFFSPSEVPGVLGYLRERLPDMPRETIERAERICRHEFDLLGYERVEYGREINWHLDAVHAKRAPICPWFRVPYLDFAEVGDAKVTWELNRHQHLVVLAIAYRLTDDSRYAAELFRQWYHWQGQNPYPLGINWASSLEVAFRSLSWLWVWHLLNGCQVVPREFSSDLLHALTVNARHIERYLSSYFSPNTHLLGEGVGLFFIGTLCPGSQSARRWKDLGWRIVLREAQRQVRPDGMHFEQSLYYHTYALDFFLHARILAARNGVGVPAEFDRTLQRMLEVLFSLSAAGPLPQFGDDDGGRLFDARRNQREHMLDPLATGAALFDRVDLKTPALPIHQEAIWLLGAELARRFEELPAGGAPTASFALRSSGLFVMSNGVTEPQRLLIDAGPHGAARAVHGHADALSVQLAINGKEMLIDPGTYLYVDPAGGRNLFRETSGHNTVLIDGMSQAEPDGPFLWRGLAHGRSDIWVTGKTFDFFSGSHDGYTRLVNSVLHRRSIFYLKPAFWMIRDVLEGSGTHEAEVCWHFAPGTLTCIPGGVRFLRKDLASLTLLCAASEDLTPEISRSWYSPCYGRKELAPLLRIAARLELPEEFATLVIPGSPAIARLDKVKAPRSRNDGVQIQAYRFCLEGRTHTVFFANGTGSWQAGSCASDARFVYYSTGSSGEIFRYVVCEGTFLEIKGRHMFTSDLPVSREGWNLDEPTGRIPAHAGSARDLAPARLN